MLAKVGHKAAINHMSRKASVPIVRDALVDARNRV
jgi:hypothetical protein